MKCRSPLSIFVYLALIPIIVSAQDDGEEEVFNLSPFSVSAPNDQGYRATNTLAGTRLKTDLSPAIQVSDSGATIIGIKTGDFSELSLGSGIRIRFAIGFYDDKEKVRRDKLNQYLDEAAQRVSSIPDLHFESGAILVPEGDRKKSKNKQRSAYTSFAHFSVSFKVGNSESPFERVRAVRRMIGDMKLDSSLAKIFFGEASPFDPDHHGYKMVNNLGASISGVTTANRPNYIKAPEVAVTLIKPADAVEIPFLVELQGNSKRDVEEQLDEFLNRMRKETSSDPNLRISLGNVQTSDEGILNPMSDKPNRTHRARAHFRILSNLTNEISTRDRIISIKNLITKINNELGFDKSSFSAVHLLADHPNKYRAEIIEAIVADIQILDKSLGSDYEIELHLENSRVHVWHHSDSEVEVWLPYNYKMISVHERELEEKKRLRAHEVAMKNVCPEVICCCTASDKE